MKDRETGSTGKSGGSANGQRPAAAINDAELSVLAERRADLLRQMNEVYPDGAPPEMRAEFDAIMEALAARPANGPAGAAVQLRVALDEVDRTQDFHAFPHIAQLVRSAHETCAALAAIEEPRADEFSEAVAAIDAAAGEALKVPVAPSHVMVEAGADAAGITPAAFRRAYAAALAAHEGGRAA